MRNEKIKKNLRDGVYTPHTLQRVTANGAPRFKQKTLADFPDHIFINGGALLRFHKGLSNG